MVTVTVKDISVTHVKNYKYNLYNLYSIMLTMSLYYYTIKYQAQNNRHFNKLISIKKLTDWAHISKDPKYLDNRTLEWHWKKMK
jgi:hypothetical protein